MTDEKLSTMAQSGDKNAVNELLTRYKSLINKISRSYLLVGGDIEDIIQEGMIGLYKAIMNYNSEKNASFKTFASTCIKNQIQSAIRVASSEKNKVLSTAMSFQDQNTDEDDEEMEIMLPSTIPSPDDKVLERENVKEIFQVIKESLSELEQKVLVLYLKGYNYNEISEKMNISKKSIDNALSRIKNKLSFLKKEN